MNSKPRKVRVECIYFRENGKFFQTGRALYEPDLFIGCLSAKSFGERLRALEGLPGLATGVWRGPFMVKVSGSVKLPNPEMVLY